MKYISTRSGAPALEFEDVLLAGLARDGGLYVPESWPQFSADDIRALRGLSYAELAVKVMLPFLGGSIPEDDFRQMVEDSYAGFDHPAVAPLKELAPNQWVCELFHGPTLAFKDYPLQLVGRLFDYVLKKRGARVTIVGATSGDTGSAAIEACRDRDSIEIFILHPKGRVSDVQRRQMTTVLSGNVHNIALDGTFDDCQDMVKNLFADEAFRDAHHLSAVNSINWSRIMAQIVYYFWTAVELGAPDRKFIYAVPTGNFGNVYAGYAAKQMGLPIEKFIVGSNENDILTRFLATGTMSMEPVVPTLSPSMDIQISSNFERLLFDYYDRDGKAVAQALEEFRSNQSVDFGQGRWQAISEIFEGYRVNNSETKAAINELYQATGELLDPHSIIGVKAGQMGHSDPDSIMVALATAHPAKFPAAVEEASGVHPELPAHLADLFEREERLDEMPNALDQIQDYITNKLEMRKSA
ncbi:MAG: threonine synthase [Rhodospirillaceae bacterium]|nr:threonine synthase [Rhodospirillaceae bacterium]MBT4588912.1 threonine synthase [Rhodospirillaceae bacterium]MBT4939521.1 threonine synthase [Rhodospirillaceae bacterium]MBT5941314.1 threonine synthase [Rhodospirillaceae bacterium]MBT7268604.1 threonine synthase [Rhodospirillaceae bacterium]